MGIYGMMRTGVSGMNAQSNRLSAVADNVANSSTTGYKRADTQFSSLVVPSGRNAYQSGGVNTHVRYDISQQGVSRATMRLGDTMIDGNGFFRVQDSGGAEYMTRAGSFERDKNGFLQNAAGFYLLDEDGQRIQVKGGATDLIPPEVTTKIDMGINLKADEKAVTETPIDPANPETFHQKKSVTVYDKQGAAIKLDVYMAKTADNKWTMAVYQEGEDAPVGDASLEFNEKGELTTPTGLTAITVTGSSGDTFPINLNLGGGAGSDKQMTTQQGSSYAFQMEADGMTTGYFESFTFGTEGEVMVTYSNGKTVPKAIVGMTTVTSPDKLTVLSGTLFQINAESGAQMFGRPGEGVFGRLQTGVLEESNADIGNELTDMIEAQRNYTANSKVFQTGSELMDVIVNLKR